MDIKEVMGQLQSKFGGKIDMDKAKGMLSGLDLGKMSMPEIMQKVKGAVHVGDLDGDGVEEGLFGEIKGKVSHMFGK